MIVRANSVQERRVLAIRPAPLSVGMFAWLFLFPVFGRRFFGVDGMDGLLTMEGFDTSLAEGVMLLTPYSADSKEEKSAAFTAKYEEKYGEIPTQFSADTYDCVYVIYQALKDGVINADMSAEEICEAMIAYMPTVTVDGVTGVMTWNAAGEVSKTPYAAVIKDGAYVGADNVEEAQ